MLHAVEGLHAPLVLQRVQHGLRQGALTGEAVALVEEPGGIESPHKGDGTPEEMRPEEIAALSLEAVVPEAVSGSQKGEGGITGDRSHVFTIRRWSRERTPGGRASGRPLCSAGPPLTETRPRRTRSA